RERGAAEGAEKLESEIEFIIHELARSLRRRGRDRRLGSAAERAPINVTRAIRVAIQRIWDHNGPLGKLLDESIRTGSFCSYRPRSDTPINWRFELGVSKNPSEAVTLAEPQAPSVPFLTSEAGLPQVSQEQTALVGRVAERAALRGYLQRAMNG